MEESNAHVQPPVPEGQSSPAAVGDGGVEQHVGEKATASGVGDDIAADDGQPQAPKALHPSQLLEGQRITGVVTRVQDSFGFIRYGGFCVLY